MKIRVLVALLPLLAGCESLPFGSSKPSFMIAELSGHVSTRYQGSGSFGVGRDESGALPYFAINSRGEEDSRGQAINLYIAGDAPPAPGTYPIVLGPRTVAAFTAWYERSGPTDEWFAADGGEVTIRRSSTKRIEGTFRFTGFRYCADDGVTREGPCAMPAEPLADAPRIEVSGSFYVDQSRLIGHPDIGYPDP